MAADYMSRHTGVMSVKNVNREGDETELFVDAVLAADLPPALTLKELAEATKNDPITAALLDSIDKGYIPTDKAAQLSAYKHVLPELTVRNQVILRGTSIVVPESLQGKAVNLAHEGHQGLVKSKQYARSRMWFPGMDKKVTEAVETCVPCQVTTNTKQQEPIKSTPIPEGPWTHLRADMF